MSISNNFLNIARRSVFEYAKILCIFVRRNVITTHDKSGVYTKLLTFSKMIAGFRKTLI